MIADLDAPGSRAVVIGTGTHTADPALPAIPAVATTAADLRDSLTQHCGMTDVRVVADPASPAQAGLAVAESAEQATDVLLVYYVGHGLVSASGELYLATAITDRRGSRLAYTALAYRAVRDSLLDSAARAKVVVLDCCFSGRAIGALSGDNDADSAAVELAGVHGGYVLASAARAELSLAPPGARHTAFTGELLRLLADGDPDGPPMLTLAHAFRYLSRELPARGFPKPHRHASEQIDDLVLAPNPAVPTRPATRFGTELRRLRLEAGLTQEQLADRSGVSVRSIRRLETSRSANPTRGTMRILAGALGLEPRERDTFFLAADD